MSDETQAAMDRINADLERHGEDAHQDQLDETGEQLQREQAERDLLDLNQAIARCNHAQAQIKAWSQVVEELKATVRPVVESMYGPGFALQVFDEGRVRHKAYDEAHVSAADLMALVGQLVAEKGVKPAAASRLLALIHNVRKDYVEVLPALEDAPTGGDA